LNIMEKGRKKILLLSYHRFLFSIVEKIVSNECDICYE